MTEVTNRTIAALLFVAMAVTVFSTAVTLNKLNDVSEFGLTGFATQDATARLNISELVSIRFTQAMIDWENGSVNTSGGNPQCNLTTAGYSSPGYTGCIGFNPVIPEDFVLKNDGNVDAEITVELSDPSNDWIGGNQLYAETWIEVKEFDPLLSGDACSGTFLGGGSETILTDVGDQVACTVLQFDDDNDSINFSLKVGVPSDSPPGVKTVDIVATATAV